MALGCRSRSPSRPARTTTSRLPHEAQEARSELARSICDQIDNDSYMVIVTEMISLASPYPRLGKWGVDEPVPATVPQPPLPPASGDWKL
jgi:hypothetical protein